MKINKTITGFYTLLILSTSSLLRAQATPVCFTTPTITSTDSPTVGVTPYAVVSADFNGDGKLDMATANLGSNDISVLLNTGSGSFSFASAVNYSVGLQPASIASADFNLDGFSDLAITNFNSNNVSILLGNGSGGFGPATNFGVGTAPLMLLTGDFNSDTKQDIAVTNYNSNNVSILLGNGLGSFSPATSYAVGTNPNGITIGDFNNDAKMDIITANSGTNTVSFLAGNGAGAFATAVNINVGINPVAIKAGDFNNNGKLDIAIVQNSVLSILLGNGLGGFATPVNYSCGSFSGANANCINIADFNNDSKLDIVTTNAFTNEVSILMGSSTGTFSTAQNFGVGGVTPRSVFVADFDGDLKKDLAIVNSGSNHVSLLKGTSSGMFSKNNYSLSNLNTKTVQSVDFNGDGKMDLITSNAFYISGSGSGTDYGNSSILLGNGMGSFTQQLNYNSMDYSSNISVADFNGDGKKDIVFSYYNSTQIEVLLGNGSAIFTNTPVYSPIAYTSGKNATGDFNGDGKIDLVITNFYNTSILLGLGNGSFTAAVDYPSSTSPRDVSVSDFNADGKEDLAILNSGANTISILFGAGDGTFGTGINYAVGSYPRSVISSDLNNDGKLDLAVTNYYSSSISILMGSSTGTFSPAIYYSLGGGPIDIKASDINADGFKDLITANNSSNDISILLGSASGTFEPSVNKVIGYYPTSLSIGDFNNDGKNDIVTANGYQQYGGYNYNITILINSPTPTITTNSGIICANDGFTITPIGGVSYAYSSGTNAVNPTITTSYTVVGTGANGCTNSAVSTVTVNPQPTININSGAICSGQTFTLVASGAVTYTYSSGTQIITPTSSTDYTVIGTSIQGCTNTAISNVTVNPIPVITVNSGSICLGSNYTITPSGASSYNYSSGTNIVNPTTNTTFYVTGTSTEGCFNPTPVACSVVVNPVPTISVNSATICSGQTYSIIPTGASSYTLTTPSSGITVTNTYWLFGPITSESYTIVGENAFGCMSTNSVVSSVLIHTTPTITVNNGVICSGKSFSFTPIGASTYSYSSGISIVSPTLTTTYTVIGISAQNCLSEPVMSTIMVNNLPNLIAGSSNSITCPGQMAFLSVNGTNSYTWSTGSQLTIISITPTVTTNYTVSGTDANGCVNTSIVTQSVEACTGIETNEVFNNMVIYPNPASEFINIDIKNPTDNNIDIKITNTLGQDVVFEKNVSANTHIDLKHLASNLYFVSISENGKVIYTKKIIKN